MMMRKYIRVLIRLGIGCIAFALLFLGIGMLPGHIEGIYRGMGVRCMCDSVNFMQFRDGKVIMFSSAHPPAEVLGRYETTADGPVAVFMSSYKEGESEKMILTATPRLWLTRFRSADSASSGWYWKSPIYGTAKATIADQEVSSLVIKDDGTIAKTFYDSALKATRTEAKQPKAKTAEQPGFAQPATQPADKPPVKDHPPTPTSKVAPR